MIALSNGKAAATTGRLDVVFIRKSTQAQDEKGQIGNVEAMLKGIGVTVPSGNWFVGTVSRRKLKANAAFNRLMEMVESDRVGTVYVESQDRWGTGDRVELFALLGILRQHDTRLYDLHARKDLTEKDFATEMLAILGSFKSEKELDDLSRRSLRSRVHNFKTTGTWPTGTHPFGYGKRCYTADGKLLWEWQPINRSQGQSFYPDASGKLVPSGPHDAPLPRKAKGQNEKTVLVPSNNPKHVKAVKLAFDLYVRVGLSRRQISARLNAQGLTFNGGPFTHTDVTNILRNPAYAGDTHFGKTQTGELNTFDANGLITGIKKKRDDKHRDASERLVKRDTHKTLVDRKTWDLAQKKLKTETERTSFSPRNPAYFLKQLFVCGHCGKGLAGRTEIDPTTGNKTVVYACSSYVTGRCNGHKSDCGYQRITHADAERLLLDKIEELGLEYDAAASDGARANLRERLERLGHLDEEAAKQWEKHLKEGIDAFAEYLTESYGVQYPVLPKMRKWAMSFYLGDETSGKLSLARISKKLGDLKTAMAKVEADVVEGAKQKLIELREEHRALTLTWAKASDLQQNVLKQEIDKLEVQIREWEPRTLPLSERLEALYAREAERHAERDKLIKEWPTLENREKGEALRRLFQTVTLFWDKTFHAASKNPTRPRKTDRPGRYGYKLRKDLIRWDFADFISASSR